MATKKQDTTAATEQEKPRAIMDLISIYDIIGGSYNLGEKLWDYLTQEEQAELLKADKEYKQWRSKILRETGEETTRKIKLPNDAEGFKDTAKELYYKARGRLWDDIKNDKEKLKKYAAEHIKGLSYAAFSFRQAVLFLDYFQDRDFGSWSYDENREEGERFQRSEASPEELELKRAKLTDYKDLAENVIDEAINKYEAQFIDISEEETEEALKEWTAYIKPYKDTKVKEWVKEAKKQQREIEKDQSKKSLAEVAADVLKKPGNLSNFYMPNDRLTNKFVTVENSLLMQQPDGQYRYLIEQTQAVAVGDKDRQQVCCVVAMTTADGSGILPKELKNISGYDMAVHRALCTAWKERRTILNVTDIYQLMKNTDARPKANETERIIKALRKFEARKIEINIAQEVGKTISKNKAKDTEEATLRDRVVNFRELERYTQRGERIFTIELAFAPILLIYADMKGQVLAIPKYYYTVPKGVKQDELFMSIQETFIKRLWLMKKGILDNMSIKFDTILTDSGLDPETLTKKQRERIRDIFKTLFEMYSTGEKPLIETCEPIKEGKPWKLTGYKVTMQTEKQKALENKPQK